MTKKIAIFAGHYEDLWEERGSKGIYTNLTESGDFEEFHTNIDIARKTVRLLENIDGLTVLFPQGDGDEMRSLSSRTNYCNRHNVDTAIFIHSNAAGKGATGACAFYWKGSDEGLRFANYYRDEMKKLGYPLWSDGTYPCTPGTWSEFYVVKHTKMPVILTENFFFTNPTELKRYLLDPAKRQKIAEIHTKAACRYLKLDHFKHKKQEEKKVKSETVVDYIEKGDKGSEVKKAQNKLLDLGYDLGGYGADGIFGDATEESVKEFQEDCGILVDGIVGPVTLEHLNKAKSKRYPGHIIEIGATGKIVERIQRKVGVKEDGIFGPITERAVKNYQKDHKLLVDGRVGPITWGVMF